MPTDDIHELLGLLARRLGMLQRGGVPDLAESRRLVRKMVARQGRCREQPPEWVGPRLCVASRRGRGHKRCRSAGAYGGVHRPHFVAEEARDEEDGGAVSATQERKRIREEKQAKRALRTKARLAAKHPV
jgi:hypothetical protein